MELRGLSKSYGRKRVLDGIEGRFALGEVTAILGQRASGKSTLARILFGQHLPDRGEVLLRGLMGPPIGLGLGFGTTGTIERDLGLRAAAYGIETGDFIQAVAGLLDDPRIIEKPYERADNMTRILLNFAAAYLVPADIYVADGALMPTDPQARPRIEPLVEATRQRAAIVWFTSGATFLRFVQAERHALLHEGRLTWLTGLEEAIEAHRALTEPEREADGVTESEETREGSD